MRDHQIFIRNIDAGKHLEIFLVSAVCSILVIRLFLKLTGYPQLGNDVLHIAHLLWGGLLMLAALFIMLTFLGKMAQRLGCIIGGIGFGAFIDEVGKFVTQDNDYFFKPSVAIMYVIFILIFVIIRSIQTRKHYSNLEYLMNAIREMEEVAKHNLDEQEKKRTFYYLSKSRRSIPLVYALKQALERSYLVAASTPGFYQKTINFLRIFYQKIASNQFFAISIILFFFFKLLISFAYLFVLVFFKGLGWEQILNIGFFEQIAYRFETLSFFDWAKLLSSAISAIFVLLGVVHIRTSKLRAFIMFERSILVSIFLTQVFIFYEQEFSALIGFSFNLLILIGLGFMIKREKETLMPEEM